MSARTAYLDALARELKAARVPARRRARILVELADHLREDPRAQMGAPDELASEFARLVDLPFRTSGPLFAPPPVEVLGGLE